MIQEDNEVDFDEEYSELELCFGKDGVLHQKEKLPTLELQFQTEEQLIEALAQCAKYPFIPEGTIFQIENIENRESFFDRLNKRVEETTRE